MKVLRWSFLIPSSLVILSVPQLIAMMLANLLNDIAALSVVFLFNIFSGMCGLAAVKIAPNRKIGAAILLPFFALLEAWCLYALRDELSGVSKICRFMVDAAMIIGMWAAIYDEISREASPDP